MYRNNPLRHLLGQNTTCVELRFEILSTYMYSSNQFLSILIFLDNHIYLCLHTLSITDEEEQREYESFKRFIKLQKDRQQQKYEASQGITEATQGDKT